MPTAELCGHRWRGGPYHPHHDCTLPADHHDDEPATSCRCRCGATHPRGAPSMSTHDQLEVETGKYRGVVWRFSGRSHWWMWGVWPRHAGNDSAEHGHSRWRWLATRQMRRVMRRLDTEDQTR